MVDHPVLHAVVVVVVAAVPGGQHLDAPCKQCTPNKSYTDGTKLGKIIEERFIQEKRLRLSALCITPWCASPRGVELRKVHHSAESSSGVCIRVECGIFF